MFENIYRNKKVLITGHTGFKGSWLTTWLLSLNAEVAGYSIDIPTSPSIFEDLNLDKKIKHHIGDIRDYESFLKICNEFRPNFIFHLAAQPLVRDSYNNPKYTFEVNMLGTLNVLEAIRNSSHHVDAAVIITSDKCYDNVEWVYGYREDDKLGGEDPYSGSKGAAELISKSYMKSFFSDENTTNISTTRAGNVIGGGDWAKDRIVPDIMRAWSKNLPVEIRNPYSTRPWQHVLEPLSGYLDIGAQLYNSRFKNESFNFGPDSKVNKNVGELIEEMKVNWKKSPGWVDRSTQNLFKESNLLKLSCDKANINLKWYPVLNFEETIEFTVSWYKNYFNDDINSYEFTNRQIKNFTNKAKKLNIKWAK